MYLHTQMTNGRRVAAFFIGLLLILAVLFCDMPVYAKLPNYTSDEAVYAVETKSGQVVTSQNAHKRMYPASTTKMMTTLVALDYVADKMGQKVTVGDEVDEVTADSSKADLQKGDQLTWHQLFYALLLPSGNDAALTIACEVGRMASGNDKLSSDAAVKKFVALMNKKAKTLGLENSHFVNPHGLHDPNHYTTAADLVKISRAALKNKTIREVVKTEVYSCHLNSGDKKWINTNPLIINPNDLSQMTESSHTGKQYNASATGVKTGHTDDAGRCLVFSSDNGDKKILAVILHADDKIYSQSNAIINTVNRYVRIKWTNRAGTYKTVKLSNVHLFDDRSLTIRTSGQASSVVPRADKADYSVKLVLKTSLFEKKSDDRYKLLSDITPGQKIGTLNIRKNGRVVRKIAVTTDSRIRARGFSDYLLIFIVIAIILLIVLYFYAKKLARDRRRREARKRRLINQQAKRTPHRQTMAHSQKQKRTQNTYGTTNRTRRNQTNKSGKNNQADRKRRK